MSEVAAPAVASSQSGESPRASPPGGHSGDASPYDALLLLSFGGPEQPADVLPFLRNVTAGRGIPDERLAAVAEHYHHFGGRSPINDQNRALLEAIGTELRTHGLNLPVYWGNRNWRPYLADALRQMRADGVQRAAVFVTSAYASYSGCRQYREDLARAVGELVQDGLGPPPRLDKLRHYFDHPGFVAANAQALMSALDELDARLSPASAAEPTEGTTASGGRRILFVTHSVPTAMAQTSGPGGGRYVAQHEAAAAAIVADVALRTRQALEWELVFCSRSGPPHVPWTGPDVNERLEELSAEPVAGVVLAPIGFISDHMEVVYDLDTEAAETAARLGLPLTRAATAGTHPAFVAAVRDLLVERAAALRDEPVARAALSRLGPAPDVCVAGCCPNPRGARPALCGSD